MRRTLSRTFAGVAAGVLVLASLAGCSSSGTSSSGGACAPSSGKVTLSYWSWVPGMDKVVNLWNSTHPNIQVNLTTTTTGTHGTYQKMFDALKAGNAPDLGQIEFDALPSYRVQGGLENIAACTGVSAAATEFPDWAWRQVTFGEQAVYAIPQDTGPLALVYRKDLFAKYGLTVPATWADYKADADKLKAQNPNVYMTNLASDPNWLAGMAWQNGAHWFGLNGSTWNVSIDAAQSRQVTDYWQQLADANELAPVSDWTTPWEKAFADGTILSWPAAAWGTALVKQYAPDASGQWAVAPLPQWTAGAQSGGNWGGSTTAVFSHAKHPYEAAQFALWLDTDPTAFGMLISSGGLFPAALKLQSNPALAVGDPYFGGQRVFDVFGAAARQVDPSFMWGPTMTLTLSEMQDAMNAAGNKQGTLSGALSTGQAKTVADLKQQGISVG